MTEAGANERCAPASSPGGLPARRSLGRRPVLAATAGLLIAVSAVTAAGAQLDESCMVSALNRTAPVDASGIWLLPNVPSGTGQLRVRATCMSGGVTRSGQSSLITVPLNGVVNVGDITFDAPQPIPARSLSAAWEAGRSRLPARLFSWSSPQPMPKVRRGT